MTSKMDTLYWLALMFCWTSSFSSAFSSHHARKDRAIVSMEMSTQYRMNKSIANQLPVIPVIGPFIKAKPLMIGGEMTLDPPTPLQWKALQECVVVHRNQLNNDNDQEDMQTATIDAAPLIAIIDDSTGYKSVNPPFTQFREGGRYATLAAVVGINSKQKNGLFDEDEENFLEYMDLCPVDDDDDITDNSIVPLSSSVRLVGVGRAVLRKFFFRVPTELCRDPNEPGNSIHPNYDEEEFYDINDTINHGYEDNTPIVMASFEPLVDDASVYSIADPDRVGEKGQKSYRKSPVHALSELNNLSIRVSRLHDDRIKLINGIKTAKARLRLYDENLKDLDGLGALFESTDENPTNILEEEEKSMTVDEFLATFKGNMMRVDPSELPQNQPTPLEEVENLENYGLNYYGAISAIPQLTQNVAEQLAPYYSKKFRSREEYNLEISSFVAYRCLEGYVSKEEMSWSLHCTSSIERLAKAYNLLIEHIWLLKSIAKKMAKEVEACGEECTDLW